MATILANGLIQFSDSRILYSDTPLTGQDFMELQELLPKINPVIGRSAMVGFPFISGGGGGAGTPGARGADGAPGPQGVTGPSMGVPGATGVQGTQGATGVQGATGAPNPFDIFAADRVVDPSGAGTDLTLASALAGLPANGGKIYIKAGAYVIPTLALPDKSVEIVGGGVGSTVITGPTGAAFFTSAFDRNRIFRDITFLGDGSAGQIFLNQTVAMSGANKIDLQNVVIPSPGIEKIFVFGGNSGNLKILDSFIAATASAASRFIDGVLGAITADIYGSVIVGGGITVTQVIMSAVDSTFSTINGFNIGSNSTFVSCLFNAGGLTLTGADCAVTGCRFNNTSIITITGTRAAITACDFVVGSATPVRWIDIQASAFSPTLGTVTGCTFGSSTSEAIRIAQTRWTICGNVGNATDCKVTEVGSANLNVYDNNIGFTTSVIIGVDSVVNDALRHESTGVATTDGFATIFTHINSKGLAGAGSIKNTGANSLTVLRTATDGYGTVDTATDVVLPGASAVWTLDAAVGTSLPEFVSFSVSVKSTTPGSPTTFSLRHTSHGAEV